MSRVCVDTQLGAMEDRLQCTIVAVCIVVTVSLLTAVALVFSAPGRRNAELRASCHRHRVPQS